MPNSPFIRGLGSAEQAEMVLLSGYNAAGTQFRQYAPVFWSLAASDCKSFHTCGTNPFSNFHLFAGVLQDTVDTADYTARILAYGPTLIRGFGQTGWFPGWPLYVNATKDYAEYATAGIGVFGVNLLGTGASQQLYAPGIFGPMLVAINTLGLSDTTGQTAIQLGKAFVRAL